MPPPLHREQTGDSLVPPAIRRVQSGDSIGVPMSRTQSGDSIVPLHRTQSGDSMHGLDPFPEPVDPLKGWESPPHIHADHPGHGDGASKSAIWWLSRVQRYSSYAFSAFAGLHLANTALVPLATRSAAAADSYLLLTRPYYQSALFEPALVLAPAALHVASGLGLRVARRRQTLLRAGAETREERRAAHAWPRLSGTSALGLVLAPLVAGHALVNRAVPLRQLGGSSGLGLGYVSHGFARYPAAFTAAYGALVGVAVLHVVWGWSKWLGLDPATAKGGDDVTVGVARKKRWYGVNAAAAVVAAVWLAGGVGVVGSAGEAGGWLGKQWDDLYRSVPVLGRWW